MNKEIFTKYERARILGARALQISMDAPVLIKVDKEVLSNIGFDPLKIAQLELDSGVLPISVKRPMPEKKEEKIEKIKVEKVVESSDENKQKEEVREEKTIVDEGEIMELSNPEDEFDDFAGENDSDAGGDYE